MSARRFSNHEIAARLERVADLLDIDGANVFRVRAYRNAAQLIDAHPEAFADLLTQGTDLTTIKGIGKDLAAGIAALFAEGELPVWRELIARVPLGLLEVTRVPGVGPKRANALWKTLGVTSLDDLERAAAEGRVAELAGFGAKTQVKILAGIAQVRRYVGRHRRAEVEVALAPILARLRAVPGVTRLEVAGSWRRAAATVGDVDILACTDDAPALMAALQQHPSVAEVLAAGETKSSVRLEGDLQVDLRVVPAASFGAAWQYFTGSKAHNVALRQRAQAQGLSLSEYGLVPQGGSPGVAAVAGAEEADVYRALGLAWIPPELREQRGEIEAAAAGTLPTLLRLADLRGDLHMHSDWSDGRDSLRAMRAACAALGYAYHAISDHSQALRMTGGLDAEKLARQWVELDALDAEAPAGAPRTLRSLEVDILRDGTLDLDEAWLARLDLVIVAVHSHLDLPQAEQTKRVLRALEHPQVNILAHPTGRLLGSREGMAIDLDAIYALAAERQVALECNASPYRLDLDDVALMRAKAAGCKLVINTDAHAVAGLQELRFGVETARRAWLAPADVINSYPLEALERFLAKAP
jgi:DNA polymerase (family X)